MAFVSACGNSFLGQLLGLPPCVRRFLASYTWEPYTLERFLLLALLGNVSQLLALQ